MPYYGDGAPYYYGGGPFSNHSSLMTGVGRYHNPIAARYSPHLSTISETPFVVLRRYSPAATATTCSASLSRPRRIIDTADIDVTKPPRTLAQDSRQQRHRLRRDRPTIKIRSQALKDNPALREYNERHEKTVGELLVEKFLIKDKQTLEAERKMKLYHQASLARDEEPTSKERENEILAAIRRRVTRRMTRRRSSADVVPLDPEQIEREAALQAAQAEALDELVAEEQAEIEIEVRRGTFAKRQAMRLPAEVSELSQTEDDEMEAEDRKNEKRHVAKKKKRRKSLERPLPSKSEEEEDEEEEEEIHIPESVIEEEEFEWDDREKCDDVRQIVPVQEETEVKRNDLRTGKSEVKIGDKKVDLKSDVKKTDLKIKSDAKVVEKELDRKILETKREDKVEQKIVESKKKGKAEEKVAKPKEDKVVDKIAELKKKDKEEEKIVESKKKDKEEDKEVTKTTEDKVVDKIEELKKKDKEEEKIVESKKKDKKEEKVTKTKEDKVIDKIAELKKKDKEEEKIVESKKKDKEEDKEVTKTKEDKVVDKIEELKKKDKEEEKIVEFKKKDKEEKFTETKGKDKVEEKTVELKKKDKQEEQNLESNKKDQAEEKIVELKADKVEEKSVELKKKDKMKEKVIKEKEDKVHEKITESKEEDKVTETIVESKKADKLEKDKVKDPKKAEERGEKNLEVTMNDRKPDKDKEPKTEEKPKTKEQIRDLKGEAPKIESHTRLKRTTSAPQWQAEPSEVPPRFKIEACNSVGDMSTLYVKSANSPAEAFRSIEQFRESIRLPAPRRPVVAAANATIDTQVVLPVRKPYVLDTSRNSVYLALKPSQKQLGADDGSSIIIDGSRKESSIGPRPAKSAEAGGDRRTTEDDAIISEVTDAATISDEAEKGFGALLEDKVSKGAIGGREEFVSWWDEAPEKQGENRAEGKADAIAERKSIERVEIAAEDKSEKVADKAEAVAADEALKCEVSPKVDVDKVTANIVSDKAFKRQVSPKVEVDKVTTNKVSDKPVKREASPKVDLDEAAANKACDLQDKSATVEEAADKRVKSVEIVIKDKPADKIADVKERAPKSPLEKEAKAEEKSKPADTQKKVQPLPKVSSEREKKERKSREDYKEEYLSSPVEKKLINHDVARVKNDLPKIDHHHLPKIPEEPKSASPTEKRALFTSKPKTNEPNNKSLFAKKAEEPSIKSNFAPPRKEREERRNRVDAEAVMKIEKRILEEAESPSKILTSAIPERVIEVTPLTPGTKKEDEAEPQPPEKKVGLPTKKKSAETTAAAATEIDFWSEIKAQESERVSGTPSKVQSPIDEEASQQQQQQRPEKLKLDLSGIKAPTAEREELGTPLLAEREEARTEQEEAKTPLIPEPEDLHTPLVEEPATPLPENLSEVPPVNLAEERSSTVIYNGIGAQADQPDQDRRAEEELSGTVKKISKWTNRDNLSNLNDADNEATPVASKEVSPQVSAASSTTKKKVVKRKKSSTAAKKKSEKGESTKTGTKKAPAKKVAASPQASLLKTPMSATGSPRNTPCQRPDDLKKLFYTTPQILLTATPRDLRKVRRAKVKRKKPPTRTPSLSSDSTGSTRSTATTSTEEGSNCEEDAEQKRLASTRSNDSGFDGSPRLSNCDMVCHKKCEKLTGNLCGLNQKLVAEALQALKKAPSQSSENQRNADGDHYHHSGRITPPATNLPRFKKYEVTDFNFLKVLGKGSFGKVLLAELRGTECVYAVKCLKKDVVLEDDDVECTLIERKVLTLATRHPYLCHLFCTFQTDSHLFFVMEYLNGGDLMFHIQKSGRFSEQRAKFYAAEIWSGLIFLHKKGIVYRDLKLDNVLLDFEGHIRIADFGMCKLQIFLDRTADTFCGTPDYMAPEIIKGLKYNQAVDWWSYGVLLYEMLTGQSPFSGCDEDELFWSICNERPFIPRYLSQSSTDILVCLLEKDSGKRIPGHEIACHPFFCTISWDKLERRTLESPFKPAVEHTLDTRYFDTAFTTERPRLTPVPEQILSSMDQEVFRGFSYTNPNATD